MHRVSHPSNQFPLHHILLCLDFLIRQRSFLILDLARLVIIRISANIFWGRCKLLLESRICNIPEGIQIAEIEFPSLLISMCIATATKRTVCEKPAILPNIKLRPVMTPYTLRRAQTITGLPSCRNSCYTAKRDEKEATGCRSHLFP